MKNGDMLQKISWDVFIKPFTENRDANVFIDEKHQHLKLLSSTEIRGYSIISSQTKIFNAINYLTKFCIAAQWSSFK